MKKRYIAIFPSRKDSLGTKIMIGSASILAETIEEAMQIAIGTVPYGWPYLLYEYEVYDTMFHTAYNPDWSSPTGYGVDKRLRDNLLEAGHTENW
jgi:hypothetical protein